MECIKLKTKDMKELYKLIEEKIGMDKVAHFFGIAFIVIVVALVFTKTTPDNISWAYAFMGFIAGSVIALFKEVFDYLCGRSFDNKDIVAGLVGGLIAFLCAGFLV